MLASIAESVAREAGLLLLSFHKKTGLSMSNKGENDVVTEADLAADRLIVDRLSSFGLAGFSFLTEESGGSGSEDWRFRWVIDPLDGTTSFLRGAHQWSVSIGCEERGVGPVAGCVFCPLLNECYTASLGNGAWLNGKRLAVNPRQSISQCLVASGFPYDARTSPDNNTAPVSAIVPLTFGFRRNGSAAMDMCWVAAGAQDAYWEIVLCPWDICAGTVIVREAGGVVLDIDDHETAGGRFDYSRKAAVMVAPSNEIANELIAIIKAHRPNPRTQDKI